MKLYCTDVLCLQETNIPWTDPLRMQVCQVLQWTHPQTTLCTSSSTEVGNSKQHQPSGTAVIVTGSHTTCFLSSSNDPSGMGQWSYIELLRKNQSKLISASMYRVSPQQAIIGSKTAYTQQYQILL